MFQFSSWSVSHICRNLHEKQSQLPIYACSPSSFFLSFFFLLFANVVFSITCIQSLRGFQIKYYVCSKIYMSVLCTSRLQTMLLYLIPLFLHLHDDLIHYRLIVLYYWLHIFSTLLFFSTMPIILHSGQTQPVS